MSVPDWIIIILYMLGMIALSAYLRRGTPFLCNYRVGRILLPVR